MGTAIAKQETNGQTNAVRTKLTLDELRRAYDLRYKHGLSYGDIGKQLGRNKSTIYDALQRFEKVLPDPDTVKVFKDQEAYLNDAIRWKMLCNLADDEKLEKESARSLAVAYGVMYDKQRLERGESTSNIAHGYVDKELAELEAERRQLLAELGEE